MNKTVLALLAFAMLTAFSAGFASSQVVLAPATPQIGSSNPVSAQPLVPRPTTKPCTVKLFTSLAFEGFTPASFNYTPPAGCPGPWAKVVFTADFTVTAGVQYDRTAAFYLGHANIFYGTTAEPGANFSPSWHVERDVTDLSAIFKSDQVGEANLGNLVNSTYTGIIYANAALEFYPSNFTNPAPVVPDMVVPVNGSGGDAGTLNTTSSTISQALDLPENVEAVYLDVIAQNQSNDEFFYFDVPSNEANNLLSFGGTAFRETEVTLDGNPAGVAPVYPWIFTGGIDPFLWRPIPANQTLDFKPYRVNLTPFAGLLADGQMHTVALSVFNANSYFLATANLLVYLDHRSQKVTGGVEENTLSAAPTPQTQENISFNAATGDYTGTLSVTSNREFTIRGYVDTSQGRVETTLDEKVGFSNTQEVDVNPTTDSPDTQNIQQLTTVDTHVTTQRGQLAGTSEERYVYPLKVNYTYAYDTAGAFYYQNTSVDQQYKLTKTQRLFGMRPFTARTFEETQSQDDLNLNTFAPSNTKSSQTYRKNDSLGNCYSETLTSASNVLTGATNDCNH